MRTLLLAITVSVASCAPRVAVRPDTVEPVSGLRIVRAGHATVWIDLAGFRVLTDPVFQGWLWMLPRQEDLGLDPAHLPPVDAVLISHTHMDHYDPWSIGQIKPRVPVLFPTAATQTIAPSAFYRDMVKGKPTYEIAWWRSVTVRNREGRTARITAVPAAHWGGRLGIDGAWSQSYGGWIVESGGHTVYFAGDTGWEPEIFRAIAASFPRLELALIPIGPVWSRSAGVTRMTRHHVNPTQALAAFRLLGAEYFIPIHYGAFFQGLRSDDLTVQWLRDEVAVTPQRERVMILPTGVEWHYRSPLAMAAERGPAPVPSN